MRRAVNIFYQCVVAVVTLALALDLFRLSQGWHIRMMFAVISQSSAVAENYPSIDEKQKAKAKEDLLEADKEVLAIAQQKPFFSFYSSDEDAAIKKAKADLGQSK
jgi:hypothetical protein